MTERLEMRWALIRKIYIIISMQQLLTATVAAIAAVVIKVRAISHFFVSVKALIPSVKDSPLSFLGARACGERGTGAHSQPYPLPLLLHHAVPSAAPPPPPRAVDSPASLPRSRDCRLPAPPPPRAACSAANKPSPSTTPGTEEYLSRLKVRAGEGRLPFPLGDLRGIGRLVIVAGPAEFVAESFRWSKPFLKDLMERGVLIVPFPTDGNTPTLQFDETDDDDNSDEAGKMKQRLWQLTPVYTSEWSKWLHDQKKLANVPPDSPVYLSLRLDSRVRGSGVGYPPWQAFVAQLPPVKGM
ncbi:hypothetical protein E2562_009039 [Oryza meyeriana var. granulata]|uniref:Uncharacterized protein n=1 Tax=Oryza meyeriana var. granulata TaxID=110450 RepID=A0A6G1D2Q6_9ORYZ|nr:hypothetical protein E2562_009039 [Oryza meyeriana var. granulata]